jgi:hypothetical protein
MVAARVLKPRAVDFDALAPRVFARMRASAGIGTPALLASIYTIDHAGGGLKGARQLPHPLRVLRARVGAKVRLYLLAAGHRLRYPFHLRSTSPHWPPALAPPAQAAPRAPSSSLRATVSS